MGNSSTIVPKSNSAPASPTPDAKQASDKGTGLPGPMPRAAWPSGPGKASDKDARLADGKATYERLLAKETAPKEVVQAVKELGGKAPDQPRAGDGTFASTKEQPAETPEVKESKWSEGDRQKAVTALSRAKVPESALKAMSEEERVQWGLDLAKGQAENDRKVTEASKAQKGTETNHADSTPKPVEQPATSGNLRGLADALALDEAGERLLAGEFESRDKAHAAEIKAVREESRAETDKLHDVVSSTLTRLARESLVKDYPDLADDQAFKKIDDDLEYEQVKPKYADIKDPYTLVRACIENLAKSEFADSINAKAKETARKESARRDAGQPAGPTKDGKGGKMGKREYAVALYNLLASGLSPDAARARLGG